MNAFQDFGRILILEHDYNAAYRVRVGILAQNTLTLLMAVCRLAEILDQYRHALSLGDNDIAKIGQRPYHADAADNITLFAARYAATARVRAVAVDRRDHVIEADAIMLKLNGIELHLILHGETAEVADIDYTGDLL